MGWISGNRYLSLDETDNNAAIIVQIFKDYGWSNPAICAMIANMRAESGCNPGVWEELRPYWRGYGLVQWSNPYTKYSDWATANGYIPWQNNGPGECARIEYEATVMQPGDQYYPWFYNSEIGMAPPISLNDFTTSTLPLHDLTDYWLWFYEHPADPGPATQALRQSYADRYWNMFFSYSTPPIWLICRMAQINNNLFNRR